MSVKKGIECVRQDFVRAIANKDIVDCKIVRIGDCLPQVDRSGIRIEPQIIICGGTIASNA